MFRFSKWKIAAVLAMTLAAFLVIVPTFLDEGNARTRSQGNCRTGCRSRPITLGLDLQGGAHILLEVDQADVIRTQVENLRDDVRRILREERIRITGGIGGSGRTVQVRIPEAADRQKAITRLRQQAQPGGVNALGISTPPTFEVREGADGLLQLTLTDTGVLDRVRRAVDQTIEVIRRRVDALGTTEPNIQRQGADRVLVQVPGLQDTNRLKELLGTTAKLEFRLVADPGYNPADVDMLNEFDSAGQVTGTFPVEKRVMVQGEDLTDAQPGFDQRSGEPIVNFRFNLRGGQRFGEVTSANVGKPFAIVLDGKVISAPRILGPITGGSGQISGRFTVAAGQRSRRAAARGRAAGQADHRRGAHRRSGPRPGFDRRRQALDLRRRGAGRHLHADDLRHLRPVREHRAVRPHHA